LTAEGLTGICGSAFMGLRTWGSGTQGIGPGMRLDVEALDGLALGGPSGAPHVLDSERAKRLDHALGVGRREESRAAATAKVKPGRLHRKRRAAWW